MSLVAYFSQIRVSAQGSVQNSSYVSETFIPVNGSIDTTAGNIYEANLTTTDKTYRWVGVWGSVTGTLSLKTTTDFFYIWYNSTVTQDSVLYFTTDPTGIDVTEFNVTNNSHLDQADTAYGYAGTVTDRIENTYTSSGTFQSPSMETGITVNTTTLQSATWTNYFLRKTNGNIATTNDIVWAVEVEPGQTAFNGISTDYEILLPENEEVGDGEGVITTYYIWFEMH
ncbi:hypothetical protein E2P64_00335 [Candidatus Bathyarchaeota archaeon]|nr:hypothetical protein E2P64_00335 [Candidatus Bathyarchaeota archaeon]